MGQQFEFFIRCLGLVLACLGVVLGLWAAAEWLQPGGDLTGAQKESRPWPRWSS